MKFLSMVLRIRIRRYGTYLNVKLRNIFFPQNFSIPIPVPYCVKKILKIMTHMISIADPDLGSGASLNLEPGSNKTIFLGNNFLG